MAEGRTRGSFSVKDFGEKGFSTHQSDLEEPVVDTSFDRLPSFIPTNHNNSVSYNNSSSSIEGNSKTARFYINENASSSTILPLQNTVSNVEFNNVRTSIDVPDRDLNAITSNTTQYGRQLHPSGSSSTLSILGKDNVLSKLKSLTKRSEKTAYRDDISIVSSNLSAPGSTVNSAYLNNGSTSGGGSAKLKKPVDLSIQTSNLMSSSKSDRSSPLVRTSKEIDRIASNLSKPASSLTQGKGRSKHHHHYSNILRPRKDPTKSSSYSNSQIDVEKGEAMYSFLLSENIDDLPVDEFLESLNYDGLNLKLEESGFADDSWILFCSLVSPLFRFERLRITIEKINSLLKIHISYTKKKSNSTLQKLPSSSNLSSSLKSPLVSSAGAAYTPLSGMQAPSFPSAGFQGSPPSIVNLTPTLQSSTNMILDEVKEYVKLGMNTFRNQVYYDESKNEVKLKQETKRTRSVSLTGSSSASLPQPAHFEKKAAFLWDYFYTEMFFYLEGIFLPLDPEFEEQQILEDKQHNQYSFDESSGTQFTKFSNMSSGSLNYSSAPHKNVNIRNLLLTSFRDSVIIPLYEQDRKIDSEVERRRDREYSFTSPYVSTLNRANQSPVVNNISSIQSMITGSSNSKPNNTADSLKAELDQVMSLIQCFTILASVQTNDTNQKIIENLMQQSREKRSVLENST